MFESLSDRLEGIFKKLKGRGFLSEDDVNAALKEIRMALLEADVNFKVVKDFVENVSVCMAAVRRPLRQSSPTISKRTARGPCSWRWTP